MLGTHVITRDYFFSTKFLMHSQPCRNLNANKKIVKDKNKKYK